MAGAEKCVSRCIVCAYVMRCMTNAGITLCQKVHCVLIGAYQVQGWKWQVKNGSVGALYVLSRCIGA